ncbi:uracil phosphoribosyltransferase [Mariniplasma anaerobium]|uniref:Uracil phosphoribosyltransferase n=1 Tax=Mariniplasma anaerobium TaxID=2735436 RepID=A0A7U9TKF1_9MOLU|nr:uracil phosphoribosyltransferase [Mariniplasma anaerobium]BCR35439.1 uracil phosphoribosyltransferase [Mariniplasma anaerobium]
MNKLVVLNHPLIDHKMTRIRDKHTGTKEFREAVSEVGGLITYEITRDFTTVKKMIETPICETVGYELEKQIVIVPILRAGLGMVEGIHNIIPTAKIGHVGLYRDEVSLEPQVYYSKFPDIIKDSVVLVVDPMLATGGSAAKAIEIVKSTGATDIRYVGLVGCPEGVKRIHAEHPEVPIYLAAMDSHLNENGYIVPGLGDCGDRLFGTK